MDVRFCMPMSHLFVIENRDRVTGPLKVIIEVTLSHYRGMNMTLNRESSEGALVDNGSRKYNGCIGSIQRNESDVTLSGSLNIPLPGPNLTHTVVDGFNKMAITG